MQKQARGFTLIEVAVTVVIVGVLTTVAVPAYKSMIIGTRLSGELNALIGALTIAQSQAQLRGTYVSVCPGTATTCTTDWSAGWIVLLESSPKQTLMIRGALSNGDTISNNVATNPKFDASGHTFYSGKLSIHDRDDTPSLRRCVEIDAGAWVTKKGAVCP